MTAPYCTFLDVFMLAIVVVVGVTTGSTIFLHLTDVILCDCSYRNCSYNNLNAFSDLFLFLLYFEDYFWSRLIVIAIFGISYWNTFHFSFANFLTVIFGSEGKPERLKLNYVYHLLKTSHLILISVWYTVKYKIFILHQLRINYTEFFAFNLYL